MMTKTYKMIVQDADILEFLNKEHPVAHEQARFMANVARTSIMMYKATKDKRYLNRAKQEVQQGKDILNGFVRPLGVL